MNLLTGFTCNVTFGTIFPSQLGIWKYLNRESLVDLIIYNNNKRGKGRNGCHMVQDLLGWSPACLSWWEKLKRCHFYHTLIEKKEWIMPWKLYVSVVDWLLIFHVLLSSRSKHANLHSESHKTIWARVYKTTSAVMFFVLYFRRCFDCSLAISLRDLLQSDFSHRCYHRLIFQQREYANTSNGQSSNVVCLF